MARTRQQAHRLQVAMPQGHEDFVWVRSTATGWIKRHKKRLRRAVRQSGRLETRRELDRLAAERAEILAEEVAKYQEYYEQLGWEYDDDYDRFEDEREAEREYGAWYRELYLKCGPETPLPCANCGYGGPEYDEDPWDESDELERYGRERTEF